MSLVSACQLIGRWRITKADLWGRDYLDLLDLATINIGDNGHGEVSFGALQAGLDLEYGKSIVYFTWQGFDEMNKAFGSGNAELLEDGTLKIEFNDHNGDEAILTAKAMPFSASC